MGLNREIVLALLEPTDTIIDCAENSAIAVKMFSENPDAYDFVFIHIPYPCNNFVPQLYCVQA